MSTRGVSSTAVPTRPMMRVVPAPAMSDPPLRHTRFWHPSSVPGLSCLEATFTAQHFAPHAHDALVIAVTESGGSAYTSRRRSAEASPSVLLVFNPTEPHAGHMRGSRYWRYRGLYLAAPAIDAVLAATGLRGLPGFTSNAVADPRLIRAFADAHRDFAADDPTGRERLIDACGRLFAAAGGASPPATLRQADRGHVDRALAAIDAGFHRPLTVETLAQDAGLSPFQLIRQFKRITGMPPHAHLVRARLHDAIRSIRHGADLADAAARAGFYDQSALTYHFRRAYGITPGAYARAARVTAPVIAHGA